MNTAEPNITEAKAAGPGNALDKQLPLRVLIPWAATALVTVVGATSWVVNRASESEVAALKTQLANQQSSRADSQRQIVPPASAPTQLGGAEDLSTRIAKLEEEKQVLVARLGELSRDALAPDSELGGLLQQLESSDASARYDAAVGLLELRDPRGALPLAKYYWRDPNAATRGATTPVQYLNAIFAMNSDAGIDFVFRMLQEDEPHRKELAANFLGGMLTDNSEKADVVEKVVSRLQDVALRSNDALVRTRAKLLLKTKAEWDKKFPAETNPR
jgi:hypothetical protein